MLASVLNSYRAIHINIRIVRVFTKMRKILQNQAGIWEKLDTVEKKLAEHDDKIILIFKYIKKLEQVKQKKLSFKGRKQIECKKNNEN